MKTYTIGHNNILIAPVQETTDNIPQRAVLVKVDPTGTT